MAFGKIFNQYFYGKAGKADYTAKDMPENRFQLFFSVLSVRWNSMIGLNLLYLVCWLPALLWSFVNLTQLNYLAGLEGALSADGTLINLLFTYFLLLFPCILITGPSQAGIAYVSRNWARDEHSFVFADFMEAFKANWKQALLVSLINGLYPLALLLCVYFYLQLVGLSAVFYLPLAVVLIVSLLWSLMQPLIYTLMVTYRLKFGNLLKNALLMTLAALPKAILVKLVTLLFPIAIGISFWLFPGALNVLAPVTLALYAVFMLSFNKLIHASYSNALAEKYLNPKIEGAQTDIGLRPKETDLHDAECNHKIRG